MNTERNLVHSLAYPAVVTGLILLIPFIAMQFSQEVDWTLSDFVIAGTLLFGTGMTYTLVTRKSGEIAYRLAIGFALFTGLFLIWVNMAVGIIGSENNEFNLLYSFVIFTGLIGAFLSKFKPRGLMFTLFSMAGVQAVLTAVALMTGMSQIAESSVIEILSVNGFFFTLFLIAGLLFRYAGDESNNQI
jgi:hypothetical protein